MDVRRNLELLGFTNNEVKVYLALLRIGSSRAGRIAKECSLERTSTYNALKRLVAKGAVSYVIESNTKVFSSGDPTKIVDVFKEKQERAQLLVPSLVSMQKWEREREVILKFRGYAGVKTALNDILNSCSSGDEYLIFGSENQLSERMETFAKIFVARKDAKKLKAKILMRKGIGGHKKSKYTQVRYVPKQVVSTTVTTVYKNKVSVIIWSKVPEAIIIDDPSAAESFRTYFEFMWQHAQE